MDEGGGILNSLLGLCERIRPVFRQTRTFERARRLLISGLLVMGTHQISRTISAAGRDQGNQDWSADYRLFSRAIWSIADFFRPVLAICLSHFGAQKYVVAALDETVLKRTGKKIKQAGWQRDSLSPPFQVNFVWGVRILQASIILPLRSAGRLIPRGVPVACELLAKLPKPKKNAPPEEIEAYKKLKKESPPLTTTAREILTRLREQLDTLGASAKTLLIAADGSFANLRMLGKVIDRVQLIVRCRRDAKLCLPAKPGGRRVYAKKKFTPEDIRKNSDLPWREVSVFQRGIAHALQIREIGNVLWQGGARRRPLRLIVIEKAEFRLSTKRSSTRESAYLLTTDLEAPLQLLLQAYVDRWEIEVNHRDEKQQIGVGDAQVWSKDSVPRNPAFAVASYSLLLLASIEAFGPSRTEDYPELPPWRSSQRKMPTRPSCRDMLMQLRREVLSSSEQMKVLGLEVTIESLNRAAA